MPVILCPRILWAFKNNSVAVLLIIIIYNLMVTEHFYTLFSNEPDRVEMFLVIDCNFNVTRMLRNMIIVMRKH